MKLFLNGTLMDAAAAALSPMDRGFTLADGLFETLAVRDGRILRLDAHLDRLAGEPMDVLVNGFLIARGEVVLVNDKFGIRLTDIVSPTERARRLA